MDVALLELFNEMNQEGGITVQCPNCYSEHFIEPDIKTDCYVCGCVIPNPLIESGIIENEEKNRKTLDQ